jgi:hypothetical protein
MASILELHPDHPIIRRAILDGRALVTARMAVTTQTPAQVAVFDQLINEMVEGALTTADGPFSGIPLVLYAAQLAALASMTASAIKMYAGAKDVAGDEVRAVLFRVLDEMGETF